MEDIEKGNISDEEIEKAKQTYCTLMDEIYDGADATDYTDILKKYYDRWGGVFDGLAKSVEIPLTTNVDRK